MSGRSADLFEGLRFALDWPRTYRTGPRYACSVISKPSIGLSIVPPVLHTSPALRSHLDGPQRHAAHVRSKIFGSK